MVQREGKSRVGACMLILEEDIMQATEISYLEAGRILGDADAYNSGTVKKNKKDFKSSIKRIKNSLEKPIEDE